MKPYRVPHVGFVGLGNQGEFIAHRIRDGGFPLHIWARSRRTLEPFENTPTTVEPALQELGQACDIVGVCVNFDDDVRQVTMGESGVISGMSPGTLLVIHSTIAPATVVEVAAYAHDREVHVLDAPVSGARQGAIDGTMSVMVGGTESDLEKALPVLETFAKTVRRVGGLGTGQLTKMLNNNLCFATVSLILDAVKIAEDLDLDVSQTLEIIAHSSGASFALDLVRDQEMMRLMAEPKTMHSNVDHFVAILGERGIDEHQLLQLSRGAKQKVIDYVQQLPGA